MARRPHAGDQRGVVGIGHRGKDIAYAGGINAPFCQSGKVGDLDAALLHGRLHAGMGEDIDPAKDGGQGRSSGSRRFANKECSREKDGLTQGKRRIVHFTLPTQ